ncbi:MAG: hypothetical protein WKF37_23185 [Bryobacteraceae bacterium]
MKRRSLLQGIPLAGLLAAPLRGAAKELASHRNLFTGDSCTYFYNPEIFHPEGLPYTAKAVHRYIDLLADNGVDTFLCNPKLRSRGIPAKNCKRFWMAISVVTGSSFVLTLTPHTFPRTRWNRSSTGR